MPVRRLLLPPTLAAAALAASPARADELWLGLYKHDVAPFSEHEYESGADIHLGWRGTAIQGLRSFGGPAPYAFAAGNSNGGTNFAAAGLSWQFGTRVYLRPGIGVAIHDGPNHKVRDGRRVDLGSRILFEPEIAAGWQLSDRLAVQLSWVHLSHARIFGRHNPGLNSWGVRLVHRIR